MRTACIDVGSTFTKGLLVDLQDGSVCGRAAAATTSDTDVMDGLQGVLQQLGATPEEPVLVCSSAGGGLRLAVIGYEDAVTALAGHRVGLSAGARVVHVAAGRLSGADIVSLRAARPDVVLLVGGTDGGNSDVLLHNAARLAKARIAAPIVLAGNHAAATECHTVLAATGRSVTLADNVLPRIGELAPLSARAAIRQVFLRHVIGGKGLSTGPRFAELVRMATPDAVLQGVEVLAARRGQDILAIDIGGATSDVYSALIPRGEDVGVRREVSPAPRVLRTVEADLGMRWSATGIVDAVDRERLPLEADARDYAEVVSREIATLPEGQVAWTHELDLARAAAIVAVRRHARATRPGESPRALREVGLVLGSGGVLRYAHPVAAGGVLQSVLADHGGGWIVPAAASAAVDTAYLLFAVGLLAQDHPEAAAALADHVGSGYIQPLG
ncbi:glutamate mutase L [Nostocoides sp.]|uniref:glutamate mutase L n=1 Tax=Nostocoides sp. TaxID=1917966 RepID=UPI002B75BE72|nr:glutamate mutase L [Tetrasphaera sp.]